MKPGEQGTWVTTRSFQGDPPEPPGSNQPCPDLHPEQGRGHRLGGQALRLQGEGPTQWEGGSGCPSTPPTRSLKSIALAPRNLNSPLPLMPKLVICEAKRPGSLSSLD